MELEHLVTARLLIKEATNGENISEVKLLEVSPSEKFAKVRRISGMEIWLKSDEIEVIEILDAKPL